MSGTVPYLYGTVKAGKAGVEPAAGADKLARAHVQTRFPLTLDGQSFTTDSSGNVIIARVDPNAPHTFTATTDGRYANFTRTGTLEELIRYGNLTLPEIVVDAEAKWQFVDLPVDSVTYTHYQMT